jgi:hypothetical protein
MSGGMTRLVNAEVAFQCDCRFPLPFVVFEAAAGDAVNGVRFEFWRFVSRNKVVWPNVALLLSARFEIGEFDF